MSAGTAPLPHSHNGRLSPGDHAICFCDDATPLRSMLLHWAQLALDAGDRVLYVSEQPLAALVDRVHDERLAAHLDAGRLLHWPSRDVFYPHGTCEPRPALDRLRQAAAAARQAAFRSLFLIMDMSWALSAPSDADCLDIFEGQLHALAPDLNFSALCLYDRSRFQPARLQRLLSLHPKIELAGQVLDNIYYLPPPERLGADAAALVLQQRLDSISSFHQDRQSLLEERTLLRTLIDALPDAIYVKDRDGRYQLCNAAITRFLGAASDADILGRTTFEVHSADYASQFDMDDRAVLDSGQPLINLERLVLDKPGNRRFWQLTTKAPLFDAQGQVSGLVGIGRDVDRLKRAEAALRQAEQEKEAILDNMQAHITLFDRDLRIRWANTPAGLNLDMARPAMVGELCYKLIHGRETPCDECPVLQAMATGHMHEVERHAADGRVWILRGFPYYDVEGSITGGIEISLEITDRKQAEDSLRAERDFVERLFAIAPAVMAVLDTEGRTVRINRRLQELTGYTMEEVVGRDWFDLFIPERERDRIRAYHPTSIKQDDMGGNLNYILTRDGRERLIEWRNRRLIDADGTVTGILGVGLDVTERHQAEEKLRQEQDFVERIFETAPVIVLVLDTQGRVVRFNPYMERLSGYTLDEVAGRDWFDTFIPAGAERERVRQLLPGFLQEGNLMGNINPLLTRDGQERSIEWYNRRLTHADGSVIGVLSIGQDVTERLQSAAALRQQRDLVENMFDAAPVILALLDTENRLIRGNRYLQEISGYALDDVVGKDWTETFIPEREWEDLRSLIPWVMQVDQTGSNLYPFLTRDGQERLIEWHNRRLFEADGRVIGLLGIGQDVTERRQAELALRDERDFIERLFELAPVILLVLDTEGRIMRFNQYLETIGGYSLAEIKGQDWYNTFVPERERSRLRRLLRQVLQQGEHMGSISPMLDRAGQERLIEWYDRRLTDGEGHTIGLLGIGLDVTERKKAEWALAESQERLAQVFRLNPLPLVVTRLEDGKIIEVNQATERTIGYARAEMLGRTSIELGLIQPQDRQLMLQHAMEHPHFYTYELPFYTRAGQRRIGVFTGEQAEIGGELCLVQALQDITERKQAQAALAYRLQAETLVAALSTHFINVPSAEVDQEIWGALQRLGRFTGVERAYLTLVRRVSMPRSSGAPGELLSAPLTMERMIEWCADGVSPVADRIVEKPVADFSWTLDRLQRGETLTLSSLDELPPEAAAEKRVWLRQGLQAFISIPLMKEGRLYAMLSMDSLRESRIWEGADVNLLRMVGEIFLNVLTRRQAEQEIITSERLAALGRLTASLAHEINNPLQIIQSHLDLVLDFPLQECERQEYFEVIRQEMRRLKDIAHNVLDYARSHPAESTGADVAGAVNRVLMLVRKKLEHQNVRVSASIGAQPLVTLSGGRLEQICLNLTLNAMEALDGTQDAALNIDAHVHEGRVHLTFANNGPPIPAERLGRIFEPFFSTKSSGSGLGLWISYTLLADAGMLSVRNLEGKAGVAFTLALNLYEPQPGAT